ncbi:50S ribosomal protein L21 [Phormidium sp. CCY1219]|uniref:50S ribosomal protein L21 n=1 Tax=Phormidium sp. CCY1219 TaxID=2886104 RepID=UPI002D1EA0C0|nr:50S ribosomal protein L21 [Phormidium sp. CCY1219]MEB3830248.1 50S ribosomal protein L21 [Phormidium sp. CCY1219]
MSTYAIIETCGKQMRVEPGRFYDLDRLPVEEDETFSFESVLLINNDGNIQVGQPFVEGATVEAKVMRHMRGRKVIVYKMQPKKKTRKKRGHRQELTRVTIFSIGMNGSPIATAGESTAAPATADSEAAAETSETAAE